LKRSYDENQQPEQQPYQDPNIPTEYQQPPYNPQYPPPQFYVPGEHYTQQMPNVYQEQEQKSPLSVLEDIRKYPTPKGTFATIIGGRPVDLHSMEDYLLKISPYGLKTILRYHNARTIEEIKNYAKLGGGGKLNTKFWLLIMLFIGLAVIGVIILLFLPQIMEFFQGSAKGMVGGGG